MAEFLIVAAVSIIVTIIADIVMHKTHIAGIDFLFYGPWILSFSSLPNAIIFGVILTFIHSAINPKIAHYILAAIPGQIFVAVIGSFFGVPGFLPALLGYIGIGALLTQLLGGMGGRFAAVLAIIFVFNVVLFSSGLFL